MKFREVTLENLEELADIVVRPDQQHLVADNLFSIAQVGLREGSWCRGIYLDARPVGFFSIQDRGDKIKYLWRFMIEAGSQGKGYGREAIRRILEQLFCTGTELVELTVLRCPGGAEDFYSKCGFKSTEEKKGNEWRMVMAAEDYRQRINFQQIADGNSVKLPGDEPTP